MRWDAVLNRIYQSPPPLPRKIIYIKDNHGSDVVPLEYLDIVKEIAGGRLSTATPDYEYTNDSKRARVRIESEIRDRFDLYCLEYTRTEALRKLIDDGYVQARIAKATQSSPSLISRMARGDR